MGLWPTRGNENLRRRPRAGGDPSWVGRTMDSRFRGNDTESVIFRGVSMGRRPTLGNESLCHPERSEGSR
jgi:hypothetical protein